MQKQSGDSGPVLIWFQYDADDDLEGRTVGLLCDCYIVVLTITVIRYKCSSLWIKSIQIYNIGPNVHVVTVNKVY